MIDAAKTYSTYELERQPYLDRARACADLVAPELIPPEGADHHTSFTRLFDSTGAQGLQSLVSKTIQVLFPTDRSFVRMEASAGQMASLVKELGGPEKANEALLQLQATMQFAEKAMLRRYVTTHLDAYMPNVFRHAYTAGNLCLHLTATGRPKVHGIDHYVVRRDHLGDVVLGIIKECVDPDQLKDRIPDAVLDKHKEASEGHSVTGPNHGTAKSGMVDLYTVVERVIDKEAGTDIIKVHQQALEHKVEGSEGQYPTEQSPFIFVWTQPVTGHHYGYSYVHTNYDDLVTLDELTENLTDIAAAAAVLRWIVKRGGLGALSLRKLHDMRNGAYLYGDPDALTPITLQGKISDMAMVENRIRDIKGRLREAFLMFGAARRDAERVTAFENAQVLNELQSSLSSFFGPLAPLLQDRIARVMLAQMKKDGSLPKFEDDFVEPVIVTGASALARETTTQAFLNAIQVVTSSWNDTMEKYAYFPVYVDHVMKGLGATSPEGLWKSQETIAEEEKQKQLAALGPDIVKTAGGMQQ